MLFYVAHELARCGWTREEIAKELLDKRNGISDHAYRQDDPDRAVWERAVNKAFDALEDATTSGAAATDAADGDLGEWDFGAAKIKAEELPPRGWLLGDWMCRQFVSSLLGDGNVGKTANRIACALALCTGRKDILDIKVFEPCIVLLLVFEDGEAELKRRIMAATLCHRGSDADIAGQLFVAVQVSGDTGRRICRGTADGDAAGDDPSAVRSTR